MLDIYKFATNLPTKCQASAPHQVPLLPVVPKIFVLLCRYWGKPPTDLESQTPQYIRRSLILAIEDNELTRSEWEYKVSQFNRSAE